mgnify:CR=1 FL=1
MLKKMNVEFKKKRKHACTKKNKKQSAVALDIVETAYCVHGLCGISSDTEEFDTAFGGIGDTDGLLL